MSSKETILARIRQANGEATPSRAEDIPRDYRRRGGQTRAEVLDTFVEVVEDYRATVRRVSFGELRGAILDLVGEDSCVIPHDLEAVFGVELPASWLRERVDGTLDRSVLDATTAVVTTSAVGISSTGTIVLDGGAGQGRRIITLLPDHHICIVRAEHVVELVPEALERLDPLAPQTWISGPSATSDIELDRVEGVHGPRTLSVLLVG